ncbi:MAG: hypothetical protein PHF84_01935 [bacterium]|nr:hypothetical protein [bacterium]
MWEKAKPFISIFMIVLILCLTCCAPGNVKFDKKPAGFWSGIWHGLISFVTFIISLFSGKVKIYETANTGGWYNFGFIIGIAIFYGGSCKSKLKKKCMPGKTDEEWKEIGVKVEEKIRKGIKSWLDESDKKGKEWREIGKKIEKKIKSELRDWADKKK